MPKISIIVPVFKVEQYIRKCIDSILSQTYMDWELILVDDGSPDNAGVICDEYAINDDRIRVIHKKNAGVGAARNTGLEIASGEYIAFVDSDDFCSDSYLQNFIEGLAKHPESDLIIQGMYFYDNNIVGELKFSQNFYDDNVKLAILQNKLLTFGAPYCKLFRKEVIDSYSIQFATEYSFGEDTYFFFEYLSHINKINMVSTLGYYYRDTPGDSLSKKCHRFEDLYQFAKDSMHIMQRIDTSRELEQAYSYNYVILVIIGLFNTHKLNYSLGRRYDIYRLVKRDSSSVLLYNEKDYYKKLYNRICLLPICIIDILIVFHLYFKKR